MNKIILLSCMAWAASAANIPTGFIPLPPLPFNANVGAPTPIPVQTPSPTLPPATKKPVVTKPNNPPTKPTAPTAPTVPTTTTVPTVPTSQQTPTNCGLNVNVPAANCNNANGNVQQSLNALRQQLDQARQQQTSQNAAVQTMISQLQTRQSGYLTKIADLQNEVRNLVQAFNSLSSSRPLSTAAPSLATFGPTSSGGVSAIDLQQAIQNVRNDMALAIIDFNNRVFNISTSIQSNEQQELKVNQAIEAQIQQQSGDIGRLTQQLTALTGLLAQLNTTSGQSASGATAADIAQLQAKIQQVASDVQKYDQSQQSQISSLNLKAGSLTAEVANHSSEINKINANLLLDESRLRNAEKDIKLNHDSLALYRQQTNAKISTITADMSALEQNVTKIQTQAKSVQSTVLNLFTQFTTDSAALGILKTQSAALQANISKISGDLGQQQTEINAIKSGMVALKNAIPISDLTTMNTIITTVLKNNASMTQQQMQDFQKALTSIQTNLQNLQTTTPSSG